MSFVGVVAAAAVCIVSVPNGAADDLLPLLLLEQFYLVSALPPV